MLLHRINGNGVGCLRLEFYVCDGNSCDCNGNNVYHDKGHFIYYEDRDYKRKNYSYDGNGLDYGDNGCSGDNNYYSC